MKIKSENRRAPAKVFSLTILGAGLFGGVLGFAAGFMNAGSLSDGVRQVLAAVLTASAPWGEFPVTNGVALGVGWRLYAKAKVLYRAWDGEDEDSIDSAEEQLSWALLMSAVTLLCDLFFFSVAVVYAAGPVVMGVLYRGILCRRGRGHSAAAKGRGPDKEDQPGEAGQRLRHEVPEKGGWTAATNRSGGRSARPATKAIRRPPRCAFGCGWG